MMKNKIPFSACKTKKKRILFPICLHMWEFFRNFAADFCTCAYVRKNVVEID